MKFDIKLIVLFAIIILICILSVRFSGKSFESEAVAQIKLGDKIIKTISLSEVQKPYEFRVETEDGGYNTIRVENGKIAVADADCPDKICVLKGYAGSGSLPIVCMPHKLTITVLGKTEVDAATGEMLDE